MVATTCGTSEARIARANTVDTNTSVGTVGRRSARTRMYLGKPWCLGHKGGCLCDLVVLHHQQLQIMKILSLQDGWMMIMIKIMHHHHQYHQ